MQQANQTVLGSDLLHDLHGQLVVVGCNVRGGIDRCKLMLCRRDLVVLGLCQDSQLPKLFVQLFHECCNTGFDNTEVVVIHFLSLRRFCTEEGTTREAKVAALVVHFLIYKEVFLLGTDRSANTFHSVVAEQL